MKYLFKTNWINWIGRRGTCDKLVPFLKRDQDHFSHKNEKGWAGSNSSVKHHELIP